MATLMTLLLAPPLLALAGLLTFAAACAGVGDLGGFVAEAVRRALERDPGLELALWLLALLVPLAVVFFLGQRSAVLRLRPTGLEGDIPRWLGLGLFGLTVGRWQVPWESIRAARLRLPPRRRRGAQALNRAQLVLETARGETRLAPFVWVRSDGPDHRLGLGELLRGRRLDIQQTLRRAPLMQALAAHGIGTEPEDDRGPAVRGFDLTGHRGLMVLLALFAAAGAYALADTFFLLPYAPLEAPPLAPFLLGGTLSAAAAMVLGRGAPRLEGVMVGTLTAAAVTAAVYPALMRFNAATARPETVEYVAVAPGRFQPPGDARPAIDLSGHDVDAYWAQYPPGATHDFTLLRGAAGFFQLDLADFHRQTRRFYAARAAAPDAR